MRTMTKQLLLVLLAAVAVARGYEPEKESQREMARPSAQHHFTLGTREEDGTTIYHRELSYSYRHDGDDDDDYYDGSDYDSSEDGNGSLRKGKAGGRSHGSSSSKGKGHASSSFKGKGHGSSPSKGKGHGSSSAKESSSKRGKGRSGGHGKSGSGKGSSSSGKGGSGKGYSSSGKGGSSSGKGSSSSGKGSTSSARSGGKGHGHEREHGKGGKKLRSHEGNAEYDDSDAEFDSVEW